LKREVEEYEKMSEKTEKHLFIQGALKIRV